MSIHVSRAYDAIELRETSPMPWLVVGICVFFAFGVPGVLVLLAREGPPEVVVRCDRATNECVVRVGEEEQRHSLANVRGVEIDARHRTATGSTITVELAFAGGEASRALLCSAMPATPDAHRADAVREGLTRMLADRSQHRFEGRCSRAPVTGGAIQYAATFSGLLLIVCAGMVSMIDRATTFRFSIPIGTLERRRERLVGKDIVDRFEGVRDVRIEPIGPLQIDALIVDLGERQEELIPARSNGDVREVLGEIRAALGL